MVTTPEKRKTIICLHENGLTTKEIASRGLGTIRTIQRIIKIYKETGSCSPQKSSGRPRVSNKRQDRQLIRSQLSDRFATSAELNQEWKLTGIKASERTVRRRLVEADLRSRRAAKKPLLSKKNIRDRLQFCKKHKEWTVEDWNKVIFSDEAPFSLFGTSRRSLVRRRNGERFNKDCVIPTIKHPDTVHVWGCFSAMGIGALKILPKNTAMNSVWYKKVLEEELFPTIEKQFPNKNAIFQHDGAPCHNAKVIKKFLEDNGVQILTPWPGNSPDLNPIENLWSILKQGVDKLKPTNAEDLNTFILNDWNSITMNMVKKLISTMPKRIAEVIQKKGQHSKY